MADAQKITRPEASEVLKEIGVLIEEVGTRLRHLRVQHPDTGPIKIDNGTVLESYLAPILSPQVYSFCIS